MADMALLKAIVSLYRAGEEKPIEIYKTRVKVAEENKLFSSFQKSIIEFLGLNEQAQKFGLGSFHLKFYHLTKINCKAETNKQTNKQTRTIKYTCDTAYMYMNLSFVVYFPLSNLKLSYFGIRYVCILQ